MEGISALTCDELANHLIQNTAESILLIDARPTSAFALNHILGAINVRLAMILMRRLAQGKLLVEDLIDGVQRARLSALPLTTPVVVYDDKAFLGTDADAKTAILCALKVAGRNTCVLTEPYQEFSQKYPQLVEMQETEAPSMSAFMHRDVPPQDSPTKIKVTDLEPTLIIPNLYIGARKDALNAHTLAALGVAAIVNVTKDIPNAFEDRISYMKIPVDDHWCQDLASYFEQAFDFIDAVRKQGKCVLVHCMAGISRSPAITISYVMRSEHLSLNAAYNFVKMRRPAISPHLDFLGELADYEKKYVVGSSSTTTSDVEPSTAEAGVETRFASSLLFDNCPWLKAPLQQSPDPSASGMDCTTQDNASQTKAPNAFRIASEPSKPHALAHAHTFPPTSTQTPASQPTEPVTSSPCIVLAPVPKLLKRSSSHNSNLVAAGGLLLGRPNGGRSSNPSPGLSTMDVIPASPMISSNPNGANMFS